MSSVTKKYPEYADDYRQFDNSWSVKKPLNHDETMKKFNNELNKHVQMLANFRLTISQL